MNIKLSQAIEGFTLARQVAGCSDYTIRNYRLDLQRFSAFLDHDPPLPDITANDVRDFLHQLQTTHLTPAGSGHDIGADEFYPGLCLPVIHKE